MWMEHLWMALKVHIKRLGKEKKLMVTGNSKNHKILLFLLSLIVQIATGDCYLKSTFATHMDYPLHKSWSGKSYPLQLQIYSLLNMCWYAACIIISITGKWEVKTVAASCFGWGVLLRLPPSHYQALLGFSIKSHHPCSTAIHCFPPQRQNILEMMPRATSVNNGSSECMSSLWPLTISLVPQYILWVNAAVKPMTIDRY